MSNNNKGFGLIELLVAMALAGIVMTAIYLTYYSQQKAYLAQEQVSAMQQNLRAAMYIMKTQIRMAGYDPAQSGVPGITIANADSINFTMDIHDGVDNDSDGEVDESDEEGNGDGDTNDTGEDVTYFLYDFGGDGDNDLGTQDGSGNNQLVAENIEALNFVYLDGASNVLDDDGSGNVVANIPLIRSIQITIVARTNRGDHGYTNNISYENQLGTTVYAAPGDDLRRKLLTTQVKCRNLGLN